LHEASNRGDVEVAQLLLEKGANTDVKDKICAVCDVHVGYVAFLSTNLLYPCLTASSVSGCRVEKCR
jgi:ankyrin repeat protein